MAANIIYDDGSQPVSSASEDWKGFEENCAVPSSRTSIIAMERLEDEDEDWARMMEERAEAVILGRVAIVEGVAMVVVLSSAWRFGRGDEAEELEACQNSRVPRFAPNRMIQSFKTLNIFNCSTLCGRNSARHGLANLVESIVYNQCIF